MVWSILLLEKSFAFLLQSFQILMRHYYCAKFRILINKSLDIRHKGGQCN